MKYTSINEIFAKVKSDLGINDTAIDISDWVTWTAEALKKVGAFPQYVTRVTGVRDHYGYNPVMTISNYECEVPCDCIRPLQVAISTSAGTGFNVCRRSTGFFDVRNTDVTVENVTQGIEPISNIIADKIEFVKDVFQETWSDAHTRLSTDTHLNTVLDLAFNTDGARTTKGSVREWYYDYTHPYLRFPLNTGYCLMAYQAMPSDDDGYPLIPDDEDLKEAIFWYINMKLRYRDYVKRIEGAKDLYKDAQYEWKQKKMAAYGNMMMPDGVDDLHALAGIWLRMMPHLNDHYSGYKNSGDKERLYNRQS